MAVTPFTPLKTANITSLCLIERELLPIEVLHCRNSNFRPFWILWPWPWPWPDDLHIRTWPIVRGDMLHVQIWTSYIKAFESCHLTDIQSQPQLYTTLLRGWSVIVTYIPSCTVSKMWWIIGQIFAVDRRVPVFNTLVRGEPINSGLQNLSSGH